MGLPELIKGGQGGALVGRVGGARLFGEDLGVEN